MNTLPGGGGGVNAPHRTPLDPPLLIYTVLRSRSHFDRLQVRFIHSKPDAKKKIRIHLYYFSGSSFQWLHLTRRLFCSGSMLAASTTIPGRRPSSRPSCHSGPSAPSPCPGILSLRHIEWHLPLLRSQNYLFSASTLSIISALAPAPATAIYCHLKLFYNSSTIHTNRGRN